MSHCASELGVIHIWVLRRLGALKSGVCGRDTRSIIVIRRHGDLIISCICLHLEPLRGIRYTDGTSRQAMDLTLALIFSSLSAFALFAVNPDLTLSKIRRIQPLEIFASSCRIICGHIIAFIAHCKLAVVRRISSTLSILECLRGHMVIQRILDKVKVLPKCFSTADRWRSELLPLKLVLNLRQAALKVDVHATNRCCLAPSLLFRSGHRSSLPFRLIRRSFLLSSCCLVSGYCSFATLALLGLQLPQFVGEFNLFWCIADVTLACSACLDRLVF